VEGVLARIRDAAVKGEEVSLPGFGKFKVQHKPARPARNPRTGESIAVAATRKLAFQPAKALKDALGPRAGSPSGVGSRLMTGSGEALPQAHRRLDGYEDPVAIGIGDRCLALRTVAWLMTWGSS
jgi:DNA-binding protein HU-beta